MFDILISLEILITSLQYLLSCRPNVSNYIQKFQLMQGTEVSANSVWSIAGLTRPTNVKVSIIIFFCILFVLIVVAVVRVVVGDRAYLDRKDLSL